MLNKYGLKLAEVFILIIFVLPLLTAMFVLSKISRAKAVGEWP